MSACKGFRSLTRALAGEIAEMKEARSKIRRKAAKIKKSELVRFLATAPKTGVAQQPDSSFEQLLDKCFVGLDGEKRASLKIAARRVETTKEIGRKLLVEAALILLGADDKLMQREAAVVLSNHDVGREKAEWDRILVKAMKMFSFLKEEESPSPLFKSLRYLISRAILANPDSAAAAAVVFCETDKGRDEMPLHMIKQLEMWAEKYTQEGGALKWHQILKALGLPERPKIDQQGGQAAASIDFRGKQRRGDPASILEFNLNGTQARWKHREGKSYSKVDIHTGNELLSAMKKSNTRNTKKKIEEVARGDLRYILEQVGDVDCLVLLETKIDLKKLLSLPGFSQWCKEKGYNYVYISWSENEEKGGAGYAGIIVLSKIQAERVTHGVEGIHDKEARVMTLQFETYTLVAVYSPCTGYDEVKMQARKKFDKMLANHLKFLKKSRNTKIVLTGDLNVNPRAQDSHPLAFLQCAKLKQKSGLKEDPGCSHQEVSMYHNIVNDFTAVNVWEHLKPNSKQGMTWHSVQDRKDRIYTRGQRLDHFVVSEGFTDGRNNWQVEDIKVFQGLGSSDHCPLLLQLRRRNGEREAQTRQARDRDVIVRTLDSAIGKKSTVMIDTKTGRERVFDSFRCPLISMKVEEESENVFIDSGAPFSIYNPPKKDPQKDRIASLMRHSNSKMNCLFKGVGGGRIEAQGNAFLTIAVGQAKVEGRFVILKTHEPTLPRFLLGMDIITGDLEGVRIKRNTVRFEIDPLVVFESSLQAEAIEEEEEEVVSLIDTKMGGSSQDWSCHFQDLAKLEAFRRSTPDPNQDRQGFVKRVARLEAREEEQAFEDVPLPAIDTKLRLDGLPATTLDAQVIIDSGSSFNLISRALALQLQKQQKDKWDEKRARVPLPDIRTANGGIMKATQCLWLQVEYQEKHVTEALPFFVFEELPLAAIIGHETSEQWKAVLSWKDKTFSFTPRDSSEVTITWTPRQGKHWRGAVNLLAKQDYVVPAGSQKKIFLDLERGSLSNQGIRGEGA